ncbi:methylated-DNA--[protein]-cysteine S-methyltransferase [Rhodophyticola sp. CCM32]|uniref:methylated-DNA--[protein]-cysteine S-methyltransferase n=1 Tax=Rhodophyticola sp. CCM32 TaxID=2916397 RepID=UPI00107F904A|nr:methylated-DNA--[protein]-cysteine S-methyltransferase [Rhodophyticola sp. CCM32]QBY00844.1 methylated-DNA--[protein]-cysteine S-methyltransferase [Rhodophyticola sp. CCM32]
MQAHASVETPVGELTLTEEDGAITAVNWRAGEGAAKTPVLHQAVTELEAYFAGDLTEFTVPMAPRGSAFQVAVCDAIAQIPFGYTRTYGEIAADLGQSAQSVGQACGSNPIPVLIPCHRVMGAKGLTGFSGAGGVETKVALLRHEGAASLLI